VSFCVAFLSFFVELIDKNQFFFTNFYAKNCAFAAKNMFFAYTKNLQKFYANNVFKTFANKKNRRTFPVFFCAVAKQSKV
jgi:hypothetical protein